MKRLAVVAVVACLVVAGCLGNPGTGTASDSPTTAATSESSATSTTDQEQVSVEYFIRAGSIPDTVRHVYLDFSVYFAERPDDIYACTDDAPLMDNEYDPTPTPLPTPAGGCERGDVSRVDVASVTGTRSLGHFTVPRARYGAHTLVVHDVTVILDNGSTASDVYDTDFRAITEREPPSGSYGVEISVTDYEGTNTSVRWRFGVDATRFDPE